MIDKTKFSKVSLITTFHTRFACVWAISKTIGYWSRISKLSALQYKLLSFIVFSFRTKLWEGQQTKYSLTQYNNTWQLTIWFENQIKYLCFKLTISYTCKYIQTWIVLRVRKGLVSTTMFCVILLKAKGIIKTSF